jgi:hypothetical protein
MLGAFLILGASKDTVFWKEQIEGDLERSVSPEIPQPHVTLDVDRDHTHKFYFPAFRDAGRAEIPPENQDLLIFKAPVAFKRFFFIFFQPFLFSQLFILTDIHLDAWNNKLVRMFYHIPSTHEWVFGVLLPKGV